MICRAKLGHTEPQKWGQGPSLVITEVWSTPPLGITVMPRGVEVGPHPWDCLRGI